MIIIFLLFISIVQSVFCGKYEGNELIIDRGTHTSCSLQGVSTDNGLVLTNVDESKNVILHEYEHDVKYGISLDNPFTGKYIKYKRTYQGSTTKWHYFRYFKYDCPFYFEDSQNYIYWKRQLYFIGNSITRFYGTVDGYWIGSYDNREYSVPVERTFFGTLNQQ